MICYLKSYSLSRNTFRPALYSTRYPRVRLRKVPVERRSQGLCTPRQADPGNKLSYDYASEENHSRFSKFFHGLLGLYTV